MSIATEITRLNNAKSAIKTSIENKGGTVGATIDTYASAIDSIKTGSDIYDIELANDTLGTGNFIFSNNTTKGYIDLGFKPTPTMSFMVDCEYPNLNSSNYYGSPIGVRGGDNNKSYCQIDFRVGNCIQVMGKPLYSGYVCKKNRFKIFFNNEKNFIKIYNNGKLIQTVKQVNTSHYNENLAYNMYALAYNNKGTGSFKYEGRLHEIKVWDGTDLIYHFVPYKYNDATGNIYYCLYEEINGTYHYSSEKSYVDGNVDEPTKIDEYLVTFVDIDGTILDEYYLDDWNTITYPDTPTQEGLSFVKWNTNNNIACYNNYPYTATHKHIVIGPLYEPTSEYYSPNDVTKIYINLNPQENARFGFYLGTDNACTVTVDWKDGTTNTYTLSTTPTLYTHDYSQTGYNLKVVTITPKSGTFYIGNAKTNIDSTGDTAMYNTKAVMGVELGNNVTQLGNGAFRQCYCMSFCKLSSSITAIKTCAFYDCYALKDLYIPSSVTFIGKYAFRYDMSIEKLSLSSALTTIEDCSFEFNIAGLRSIILPQSLTAIKTYPITGIISLKYASFNNTSASISYSYNDLLSIRGISGLLYGKLLFNGGQGVTVIDRYYDKTVYPYKTGIRSAQHVYYGKNIGTELIRCNTGNTNLTDVTLAPNNFKYCNDNLFQNAYKLRSINIENYIGTGFGVSIFNGCYSLRSITEPASLTSHSTGGYTYANCSSLENITLSSKLTAIQQYDFNASPSFKSIDLPSTVTSIGQYAFRYARSLKYIDLKNVTSIGNYAFNNTQSLKALYLPSTVTSIGTYAFWGNNSCSTVVWNSSQTFIPQYGIHYASVIDFSNCSSILSFNAAGATTVGTTSYLGTTKLKYIIVPDSLYSSWYSDSRWANFKKYIISKTNFINLMLFNANDTNYYIGTESVNGYKTMARKMFSSSYNSVHYIKLNNEYFTIDISNTGIVKFCVGKCNETETLPEATSEQLAVYGLAIYKDEYYSQARTCIYTLDGTIFDIECVFANYVG